LDHSRKKNKHGLSRYVPSDVRRSIRKSAGFGCVFCGCVLVEYEHIEPEFNDALEHDPEKMTILCPMCHDKVTKNIISKKQVLAAKGQPKGLEQGYVNDMLFSSSDKLEFLLGDMRTVNVGIVISLYGKPLFWFEETEDKVEPYTICCIFYGRAGSKVAYINRNEYIAIVGNQDVVSEGSKLTISDKKNGCILEISRKGGEPLHVKKLYTQFRDIKLLIKDENNPVFFGSVGSSDKDLAGLGSLTLEGRGIASQAIALGDIPAREVGNKLNVAVNLIPHGTKILDEGGRHKGWVLNGDFINLKYEHVGVVRGSEAYSITGEFVSNYKDGRLVYPHDQYDDGEPIFVKSNSRKGRAAKNHQEYDLSHRLFGL